jgi:hypothetical protein
MVGDRRRDVALVLLALGGCAATATIPPPPLAPALLPIERHGHRVERVRGGLLSFGGFGDPWLPDRGARETWWLAPGATSWQRRADLSLEHSFFASAVVDGAVVAIGNGIERYDFERDRWELVVPAGALPRSHFGAAALGRTLFVLGGFPKELGELHVVDLESGTVRVEPSPPSFRPGDHFHFVQTLGGKLHVIGGLDGETFRPRREHWIRGERGWEAQPPPPEGLWAKFAVQAAVGDALYLFGDFGGWRLDAASGVWTSRSPPPEMLVMAPSAEIDGTLWVIGGMGVERPRRVLLAYDVAADTWRDESP